MNLILFFDMQLDSVSMFFDKVRQKGISARVFIDQKESPVMLSGDFWSYVRVEFKSITDSSLFAICFGDMIENNQVHKSACEWTGDDYWHEFNREEHDNDN